MGLYIAGMDMPVFEHQSWDIRQGADGKWYIVYGEWHEIVSVPEHGRLIDADGEIGVNVTMMPGGKCKVDLIAPTVIPAEEGEQWQNA